MAEYRKPEFQATVTPTKNRYLAGQPIEFTVQASYYFGAPVPNATVRFQARSQGNPFYSSMGQSGFNDGNLYDRDTYATAPFVAEDTVQTDDKGRATIRLNTLKSAPDSVYEVSATVIDASRRQVEAVGSVPVYAAAKRIGLRTDVIVATLGSIVPVDIRVVDLDDSPATAHVHLRVFRNDWDDKKQEYVEHVLTETQVLVPPTGKLRYSLPALRAGDMIVEAICDDGTGRKTSARLWLEVAGNFGRNTLVDRGPNINIRLDRNSYVPGQIAHAFVTTNSVGHPILLVTQGQDVFGYHVVESGKGGQLWDVTTARMMAPNAFVSACEWVKGHLVAGTAVVPIPDPSRRLSVSVIPDRSDYRPGDKANMVVRVRNDKGLPASAEISLAVVDASIYAVSPDTTMDPYDVYWNSRGDQVTTGMSAPEELSGGAYQASAASAPVRSRFVDTALWAGIVQTDPNGEAHLSFEVPGNLTTWRATAYGVTLDTGVGKGATSVLANRDVMLRLATPRQLVVGDRLVMIGTVNNRTKSEHLFNVRLQAEGVSLQGASRQTIRVPALSEGHVEWVLNPTRLPENALATLTGDVIASDSSSSDLADALKVTVPIVPKAVRERTLVGGVLGQSEKFSVHLPVGRAEPATTVDVEVRGSLGDVQSQMAESLLKSGRYGTPVAVDQLVVAAATRQPGDRKEVRDALAMLARDQSPSGWGWWQSSPSSAGITSRALRALTEAKKAGLPVYDRMYKSAVPGAESLYDQINLWDSRALLAASLVEAGSKRSADMMAEVLRRGQSLSPYARIRMAEAEHAQGHVSESKQMLREVLSLVSQGPQSSYMPVGEGLGWTASTTETTAEALVALVTLKMDPSLQPKLARWLAVSEEGGWRTPDDLASIVRSLAVYTKVHPSAGTIGPVTLTVNGLPVATTPVKVGQGVTARVPRELLKDADNVLVLGRTSPGETFVSVDTKVYLPHLEESVRGIRVLRRIEVQNSAGIWVELNRSVKAGEPVRITMVAWGDDLPDALRISDPIPAGFEFVSDESQSWSREEVRDGAVIHYLTNGGEPQTFRYYIRAESEGRLNVLPASVEFLRRPAVNGQTSSVMVTVQK